MRYGWPSIAARREREIKFSVAPATGSPAAGCGGRCENPNRSSLLENVHVFPSCAPGRRPPGTSARLRRSAGVPTNVRFHPQPFDDELDLGKHSLACEERRLQLSPI